MNAFVDDKGAFERELFERCGENARAHEVTDGSDSEYARNYVRNGEF